MNKYLLLCLLLIPNIAQAVASVPGGGGTGQVNSLDQLSGTLCPEGEGLIWLSSAADCQAAVAGSGDSVEVAGAATTNVNFVDTAGSGGIDFSLNTTPAPDAITAVVIDGAIAVAKLASADFGDFTCNGSACTVDANSVALSTDTTGGYVQDIAAGSLMSCVGCSDSAGENKTVTIGLNLDGDPVWTGFHTFGTGGQLTPPAGTVPDPSDCQIGNEGRTFVDTDAPTGQWWKICEGAGGWKTQGISAVSVEGNNVVNPNLKNDGDVTFGVAGSNVTPTINPNAVALATDTTGNYVATVAASAPVSCSGCTAGEGSTATFGITSDGIGPTQIDETVAYTFPILNGKQKRNTAAVDDDDCSTEQGVWWYDSTDAAFEFCNANSGTPIVLGNFGFIPTGTAPTVASAGAIGEDTTATQTQLLYGAAPNVLSPLLSDSSVIEALAAADDNYEFWMAPYAVTIKSVGCRCRGTCTTAATLTLEDRAGNAMTITGTNPTCATTGIATFAAVTAGGSLVAGEGIAFDVTNTPNPETDIYTITINYTIDRQ